VQYQLNSALDVAGLDNGMWNGILERVAYVCNAAGDVVASTDPATYVDYAGVLRARTATRNLKTITDDAPTGGIGYTPFASPVTLEDLDTATLSAADLGCSGTECTDAGFVSGIVDFMHGTAPADRATYRLADIFHANVQIVGRPNLDLPIASYFLFQEDRFDRTQAAYVATNDGILHAFRVNNPESVSVGVKGEELWGFTPNYLLPQLKVQVQSGHMPNLDSSPVARDVRFFRDASGSSMSSHPDWGWHTVLLGGYREGGRGYYALDITEPDLTATGGGPQLLWEISNTTEDTGTAAAGDWADLWKTWGAPSLGTVFTQNPDLTGTPLGELAVAFLPGGRIDPPTDGTTGLYVVSTKTGRLLRKLMPTFPTSTTAYTHCGGASPDCTTYPQCCAQLIGTPVGYGAVAGTVTTRVFAGDDRGRIWRADVSAQDPADWKLELFYPHPEPPTGEPAAPYVVAPETEYPPTLALDNENRVVVVYGTGKSEDLGGTATNYVISVTEHLDCTGTPEVCSARPYVNWIVPLNGYLTALGYRGGEVLTGQPVVFNRVAYFTTFAPNPGECTMGEGRIWALDYTDDSVDAWTGVTCGTGGDRVTGSLYCGYPNTYIAGLNVIQRPSCIDDTSLITPGLGGSLTSSSTSDRFELVAQVGNAGGRVSTTGLQRVPTISMEVPAPMITTLTDSWGLVFE
jgi:hypothetical protein